MRDYSYYKELFADQHFPLAYVDMNQLDTNIEEIQSRVNGDKFVRIASKSIRSRHIIEYILSKNDLFNGVMAYSGSEALYLSEHGFDDILIAYPIVDCNIISKLIDRIKTGALIYFMIDSIAHLSLLQGIGADRDAILPVCIDIDLSHSFAGIYFGVYRSPLSSLDKVKELVSQVGNYPNIVIRGVMGYEAQIAGVPDHSPARNFVFNFIIRRLKQRSISKIKKFRADVIQYLNELGIELDFVNGGGTGSVETTTEEDLVTEVTVGSGFYSPALFDYYKKFRHQPACGFAIQVTRIPQPGVYTCHGGGYIASGAVGKDKEPKPLLPEDVQLFPDEGLGEVQTPIKTDYPLQIGDPVFFRHAKAGELCEHFNQLSLVRDGVIEDKVTTYRGEGLKFL